MNKAKYTYARKTVDNYYIETKTGRGRGSFWIQREKFSSYKEAKAKYNRYVEEMKQQGGSVIIKKRREKVAAG